MPGEREAVVAVLAALAALPRGRWLLAVSGGRDSMVLLDAMARARGNEVVAVATFDHGTGAAATRAAALVEREAEGRGISVVSGRAPASLPRTEEAWRVARRGFLAGWARELRATVVTAHMREDQVETVLMRLLRDAGPRGLAGMRAGGDPASPVDMATSAGADGGTDPAVPSPIRPLLALPRDVLDAYARHRALPFVEDPSNRDIRFLRNRVRHELLPAFERAVPGFADWCWALGERAAAWRGEVAALVDALGPVPTGPGGVALPLVGLERLDEPGWAVLLPELAARAGVVLDRRGLERAASWTPRARPGSAIPLAGGAEVARTASTLVVRGNDGPP